MNLGPNTNTPLLIRAVFLEDLKPIVKIYKGSDTGILQNAALTEDFGIPVCVAESNKQIVGCLFLHLCPSDPSKVTSRICVPKEFEGKGIEQLLRQKTNEKISQLQPAKNKADYDQYVGHAFGFDEVPLFKGAVSRFVNWLNLCD